MKLVIQIPCYNEAKTLPTTIRDIPSDIPGIDSVELLVIDDGSSDGTADVAKKLGVDHILTLPTNQGLARAFASGLKYAISLKPDIIVNTDGDNQYAGASIPDLIKPIIERKADLVVGCRPISNIPHFSLFKKFLQKLGSRMVRLFTGIDISDVTTGFRAYSLFTAQKLKIFSNFTYTIETLIQASQIGIKIISVPVEINPPTRKSRLFINNWYYVRRQAGTILRIWSLYSPVKLFWRCGYTFMIMGGFLFLRFCYYYFISFPDPSGKVQSLLVAAVFILSSFFLILIGVIADLISVNRKLVEEVLDQINSINDNNRNDND